MIIRDDVCLPWMEDPQDVPCAFDAWGSELYEGETAYDVPGIGKLCKENFEQWIGELSLLEIANAFGVELVEVEVAV